MESATYEAPSSKKTGMNENGNQNGHQNGGDADNGYENDDEEPFVERSSRIAIREPRLSRATDTDKLRQDLNELRERFTSDVVIPPQSAGDSDVEVQNDVIIGDLKLTFITDTEIKYTYTKAADLPLEDGESVNVTVAYKTFEIHKNVLKQSSSFFRSKLESEPDVSSIELESNIGITGFTLILDFLYDGVGVLNPRIGEVVFDTAAALEIDWVTKAAADYLLRQIGPKNYRAIRDLFEKYKMADECGKVIRTVAQNLVEFSEDVNFLRTLQYDLLKKILSENYYIDGSEGFVTKIILDWVFIDDARKERLPFLVKFLRLPLMEPEELLSLPENLRNIPGFDKEIDSAMEYVCNISAQYKYTDDKYLSRGYRDVVTLLSATEANNGKMVSYKNVSDISEPMCMENIHPRGLDTMLVYTNQATLGNFVYAAGGLNDSYSISGQMFRYDPRIRDWQELATMIDSRMSFALVASDKNLFAVGGESQGANGRETVLNTAERYDPDDNSWSKINSIPTTCMDNAGVFYDNKLYISGGVSSKNQNTAVLDDFYCYNINNGTWLKLERLPTPRVAHAMVVVEGMIYVIGGHMKDSESGTYQDCLSVELYDPVKKCWNEIEELPRGMGSVNRNVAVVGYYIVFLAAERWQLYDTRSGEVTHGEYSGSDVQRVAYLKVAYPPTDS